MGRLMTEGEVKLGLAGLGVISLLAAALVKFIRARNGKQKAAGWTKELATYIDDRASHKANNAVAPVLLQVSNVVAKVADLKHEAEDRFNKVEGKIDAVKDDVGKVREDIASMRGELGHERRQKDRD
jgi:hypothetical protein